MSVRRTKNIPSSVPVASMGDIAFLLIIFFILTSTFMKKSNITLDQPRSPDIDTVKETQVTVSMDRNGVLRLQGNECPPELLEGGVESLLKDIEEKRVMVEIDKDLPKEKFQRVFLALSRAGAEIVLVGEKIKE